MTINKEIKPMLTANEVARFLNVHINTVRRWSNRGILKTYRIGRRGDRRFERMDVIKLLLEQSELVKSENERRKTLGDLVAASEVTSSLETPYLD